MKLSRRVERALNEVRWRILIWAARSWAEHGMDQFERVKIDTSYGHPVYLSLDVSVQYPASFEEPKRP